MMPLPPANPGGVIDDLRDYLAAVTAELGVGLESCCWGDEPPAWAYVALDWRRDGRDVALVWDGGSGWSLAMEPDVGRELSIVATLGGEVRPQPTTVGGFVSSLRSPIVVTK